MNLTKQQQRVPGAVNSNGETIGSSSLIGATHELDEGEEDEQIDNNNNNNEISSVEEQDEREEEDYLYETNRVRKLSESQGGLRNSPKTANSSSPTLATSTNSTLPVSDSTNSSSNSSNSSNQTRTTTFATTAPNRVVLLSGNKALSSSSSSSLGVRQPLSSKNTKLSLSSFAAEPLFAAAPNNNNNNVLLPPTAEYVFKIRILTEENVQLSEFELNVSCKRMSSTSAIGNGMNTG